MALTEAGPPEALGLVQRSEVDLAVVLGYDDGPVASPGLTWRRLASEPVDLVVPLGRPLVRRRARAGYRGDAGRAREVTYPRATPTAYVLSHVPP